MARDGERRRFIERAAEETRLEKDLIKRDLGRLLLLLEQAQTERIRAALEPAEGPRAPEMTAEERAGGAGVPQVAEPGGADRRDL